MIMLLIVRMPHEPFNAAVRDGTAGEKMRRILEAQKPKAAYWTEMDGRRTGVLVVTLTDPSQIPAYAEPWFLSFRADVEFHPCMTTDDLGRAGLDRLGQTWG